MVSRWDELLDQDWLAERSTFIALVDVPPRVTAPEPEAMVMPPEPMVKAAVVALPSSIVVAAVFEMVMPAIVAGVPLRFAVDAVLIVKAAVSVERGGVSVPNQLPDVLQLPVPTFHVDVDARTGLARRRAKDTVKKSECLFGKRRNEPDRWEKLSEGTSFTRAESAQ